MKKKKQHSKLDGEDYLPQEDYSAIDDQPSFNTITSDPPQNTIPVPIMSDTFNNNVGIIDILYKDAYILSL